MNVISGEMAQAPKINYVRFYPPEGGINERRAASHPAERGWDMRKRFDCVSRRALPRHLADSRCAGPSARMGDLELSTSSLVSAFFFFLIFFLPVCNCFLLTGYCLFYFIDSFVRLFVRPFGCSCVCVCVRVCRGHMVQGACRHVVNSQDDVVEQPSYGSSAPNYNSVTVKMGAMALSL